MTTKIDYGLLHSGWIMDYLENCNQEKETRQYGLNIQLDPVYQMDTGKFYAKLLLTRNNKDMHCIPYMTANAMRI